MENKSNSLVTLVTASLIHEVHIAKTLLSSNNIESYIFDENIATSIGTAFVEGYKLKVSSSDFKKAKKILDAVNEENNT
jgi:hypothetical protein